MHHCTVRYLAFRTHHVELYTVSRSTVPYSVLYSTPYYKVRGSIRYIRTTKALLKLRGPEG